MTINQCQVAYGIGKDGVAFVIFTDIDNARVVTGGKSGLFSSQQKGLILPVYGPRIDYAGNAASLKIGGKEYTLAKGRVFLVATKDNKLDIQQLDLPIHASEQSSKSLQGEIRRLAKDEKVSAFMPKAG